MKRCAFKKKKTRQIRWFYTLLPPGTYNYYKFDIFRFIFSQLITMFFGANDLCSGQCYDKDGTTPLQHSKKLQKALDYLQANLPRTLVNLVPVLGGCTLLTFLYLYARMRVCVYYELATRNRTFGVFRRRWLQSYRYLFSVHGWLEFCQSTIV